MITVRMARGVAPFCDLAFPVGADFQFRDFCGTFKKQPYRLWCKGTRISRITRIQPYRLNFSAFSAISAGRLNKQPYRLKYFCAFSAFCVTNSV